MCGITGFTSKRADKAEILTAMMDAIAHRGPDGAGQYIDEQVALGHRRLSILDLEGGKQPMFNEDGRLVVVFNGEIYNFQALRTELQAAGHTFATDHSDTEVLLHGYEEWGREMVTRLRGMFAFAIWDKAEGKLFCARDHFGIKPFYYYHKDDSFMFGSEIKSFLENPEFDKRFNPAQLQLYLSFQYSPGEDAFFQNVKKLLPAHWLEWQDGKVTVQRYWSPSFDADETRTLEDWETDI